MFVICPILVPKLNVSVKNNLLSNALKYTEKGFVELNVKCINTTELVEEARKIHDLSPVATAALGRLLTMGCIMGSGLKEDNDTITLQIKADGPLGSLNAVVNSNMEIKGYVQNPNVDLPLKDNG